MLAAIREVMEPQNQHAITIDEGAPTLKTQLGYFLRPIPKPDKIRGAIGVTKCGHGSAAW